MNMYFDPKETDRVAQARDSFAGRLLTDTQFNEAMAITCLFRGHPPGDSDLIRPPIPILSGQ